MGLALWQIGSLFLHFFKLLEIFFGLFLERRSSGRYDTNISDDFATILEQFLMNLLIFWWSSSKIIDFRCFLMSFPWFWRGNKKNTTTGVRNSDLGPWILVADHCANCVSFTCKILYFRSNCWFFWWFSNDFRMKSLIFDAFGWVFAQFDEFSMGLEAFLMILHFEQNHWFSMKLLLSEWFCDDFQAKSLIFDEFATRKIIFQFIHKSPPFKTS